MNQLEPGMLVSLRKWNEAVMVKGNGARSPDYAFVVRQTRFDRYMLRFPDGSTDVFNYSWLVPASALECLAVVAE